MRDKVLAALAMYAEGATAERSIKENHLSWAQFYKTQREHPELQSLYRELKQNRADMAGDKILALADELVKPPELDEEGHELPGLNANRAREAINAWLKMMGKYHPEEFGDKLKLEHEVKPSLSTAIEEAKRRIALPQRDLAQIIDVQAIDTTPQLTAHAPDKQSEASQIAADDGPDPFEEP